MSNTIINTATQTIAVTQAAPIAYKDFYFTQYNTANAFNGNLCVNVLTTSVAGDTDTLTLTATPIISDSGAHNIPANGSVTLASALDWATDTYYTYPITTAVGPCIGLRITANITGVEAGTSATVKAWVCYA